MPFSSFLRCGQAPSTSGTPLLWSRHALSSDFEDVAKRVVVKAARDIGHRGLCALQPRGSGGGATVPFRRRGIK
jgi:hypothetical protein